jgi:hypothetical protein
MKSNIKSVLTIVATISLFYSCTKQKDVLEPAQISEDAFEHSSKTNNHVVSNAVSIEPKAYVSECNTNGTCSGGPIFALNSSLTSIVANTGAYLSTNTNCFQVASAYNWANGKMYVAMTDPNNSADELYEYDLVTHVTTFITALTYNNVGFRVNEMEFDGSGNLYLLRKSSDRPLYRLTLSNTNMVYVGNMFAIHIGLYKEALAYNQLTNKLFLVYETAANAPTRVAQISTVNANLSNILNYTIPNPFTNNISAYFYDTNLRIIRDDNAGVGSIYNTSGTLLNTINARSSHDATYNAVSNP